MRASLPLFIILLMSMTAFGVTDSTTTDTLVRKKIYRVNKPVVWTIIGLGALSDAAAISRIKNKPDITDGEIAALNRGIIDGLDRWAIEQDVSSSSIVTFKNIGDYGQIPVIMLPALLALNREISKDWKDLLLIYAEGHIITFSFYNYSPLGPTFQNKFRPYVYYDQFPMEERQNGYNRSSFYSGHVATCAYSTFFMAKVFCDYHPHMKAGKYWTYAAAAIPPLLMGYCRVRSLDHFPSDNLVGLMLGGALGIIVPELHKFHNKDISLGMITSPDGGVGLNLCWNLSGSRHQ